MKKYIKKILIITGIIISIGLIYSLSINFYIKNSTKNQIITLENIPDNIEAILILGAGVKDDGKPSHMLEDRLITGIKVYEETSLPIIVSGDHGTKSYDEVNIMKQYLIDEGIPSEEIFMDHAGFSTYDSLYRSKEIFEVKNIIIITQEYHLYRSLFIANKLDINAYGIKSDIRSFAQQPYFDFREYLARNKDFIKTIFKPKSKYLGDAIPISKDGNITNDQ